MYEHHKSTACSIVVAAPCFRNTRAAVQHVQSEHDPGNWKPWRRDHGFLSSATHMCLCAVTVHGLRSLHRRYMHVCVCVCVFAREESTRSQVRTAPPAAIHKSARVCNTHLCEVTHSNITINRSSIRNQATGSVTTGSLLLQHTRVCPNTDPGSLRRPRACVR